MLKRIPRPTIDLSNKIVASATTVCAAVIGSATSFLMVISFFWAIIRMIRKDFPLTRVPEARTIGIVLALFFVVEALCGFISYNGAPTLREIVENTVFLSFIPIYSRLSVSSREGIREALELAAAAGAFAALGLALFQVAIIHMRAEGSAGNADPFAVASLVGYAILWLGCMRASGQRRIWLGAAICAAAFCVILSGTRILWPALFVVPIVAGLIYRRHFPFRRVAQMAAVLLLLVGCFGLLNARFIERRVSLAIHDVHGALTKDDYSGSFGKRLVLWRVGFELFREAPVFGQGPGNAKPLIETKSLELTGHELKFSHYHEVFLNFAVRDGVLGVLIVLAMIITPLALAARHKRDEMGTYGLAFLAAIEATFLLSGSIGIMFGQDIMDSLFMISMIVGSFLVFGPTPGADRLTTNRPTTPTG